MSKFQTLSQLQPMLYDKRWSKTISPLIRVKTFAYSQKIQSKISKKGLNILTYHKK